MFFTVKEPESVFWVKLLAANGSIPGDELPQIIEIEAVGAIEVLLLNLSFTPTSAALLLISTFQLLVEFMN